MKKTGLIFDFNGTLFWDSEKQEESWQVFSEKLISRRMSEDELKNRMHGRTNQAVMEYLLGEPVTGDRLLQLIQEKEQIYRDMCRADSESLKLAPGAEALLDYLVEKQIPRTIATASEITNLTFFIEVFQLEKWFDLTQIVFDDGSFPGKPDPAMYLKAAEKIGVIPEDCIVIEDSVSGIQSGKNGKQKSTSLFRESKQIRQILKICGSGIYSWRKQ